LYLLHLNVKRVSETTKPSNIATTETK